MDKDFEKQEDDPMSEEVKAPATPAAEAPKKPAGKRHKNGHPVRNAIIALVTAAALGVGGFFLLRFLTSKEDVNSQIQTAMADWSSIQSSVSGMGNARAKESATITLQNSGIVQSVYVSEGQVVYEGDPLYEIVSPAAQEAYNAAVKRLNDRQDELQAQYDELDRLQSALLVLQAGQGTGYQQLQRLREDRVDLMRQQAQAQQDRFVRAPFSGQLQSVTRYEKGDHVAANTVVAKLIDDSRFRASFYFSYAYQGQVFVGQKATVTALSGDLAGVVEEVNMVRRVSPEGSILFEAVIAVPNPGALTEGISAHAALAAADGTPIYPYDAGTLEYYRQVDIYTKTEGDVLSSILRDYADVKEGQVILTLSEQDFTARFKELDQQILDAQAAIDSDLKAARDAVDAQNNAIETALQAVADAEEGVAQAQKAMDDFSATAPITGTVTFCSLMEGMEVNKDETVISISNNTTMTVQISVDDRNIAFVNPGMGVELSSYDGGYYYGTVTKIDMSLSGDSIGQGMTNYPVTLEVDNFDGSLRDGAWLNYSFITSQADNCIVVPMQSVKYMSLEDGTPSSVVFIHAEARPDNAVELDLPVTMPGEAPSYPTQEDGYYAVPVTTGLSDNYNVEIRDGLMGGEEVFVSYIITDAAAWG